MVTFSLFLTLNSFSRAGRNIIVADGDIPESVIEAFVEKIEVSKDCFKWYLRGDFGGDSPIPMNVEGNRKKGATISPQYIIPPANFGDSGRHQRKQVIADFIKQNYPPADSAGGFYA